jgi:ribose transport system permease protein
MTAADTSAVRGLAQRIFWADALRFLSRWGTIISIGVLVVLFSLLSPGTFPTGTNVLDILNQVAVLGVISLGLTTCLAMGLFDLSIAGVATFGGWLVANWLVTTGPAGLIPCLAGVLAVAACIGIGNGVIVSYMGVNAFIATLAMGQIINGVTLGLSNSATIQFGIPDNFLNFGQGQVGPVPNPVIVALAVAVILWLFLERTQPGRLMYAIGGNAEAARLSGIRVKRYALIAFGISAVCAALGGIMAAAVLGVGRPQGVGETYLLDAFAAAFIGASTLRPGTFHVLGTIVGVLLLGVIENGLSILGVATFWQLIVEGTILVFAVTASGLLRRR